MTARIDFQVTGLTELRDRLNRGDTMMRIALNEGLRKIGRLFVPAKGTGPLADETPKRTEKLARSTFFKIEGGTQRQQLLVMQPAQTDEGDFYGWFVREGTRPHEIRAIRAKALRFEKDGEVIFRRKVQHPGTMPNPYHHRTMQRLMPQVQAIANEMGRKVTAYISGKGGV